MKDLSSHPSMKLLDALHDAVAAASRTRYSVEVIADKLSAVGLDRLAEECDAAVAGLTESLQRLRDAHGESQVHELRESERGVANMLTAIVEGCIVPKKSKKVFPQ